VVTAGGTRLQSAFSRGRSQRLVPSATTLLGNEPDQDIDFRVEAGDSVESISALRMIEETARHAGHAAICAS
jgi:hypothetical protein